MEFAIIQVLYYINAEPVTIVAKNPLGGLTNFETTQTALGEKCVAPNTIWGDAESKAIVDEQLPTKFPGVTCTSTLYVAPPASIVQATVQASAPAAAPAPAGGHP